MKCNLITTIIIALITFICGYFLGTNLTSKQTVKTESTTLETNQEKLYPVEVVLEIPNTYSHYMVRQWNIVHFLQKNIAIINDKSTIQRAVKDYRLNELFKEDVNETFEKIKRHLKAEIIDGTNLIRLGISSSSDKRSKQILYALEATYRSLRQEALNHRRDKSIADYNEKKKQHENLTNQFKDNAIKLAQELDIPYHQASNQTPLKFDISIRKNTATSEQFAQFNQARDNYEREFAIQQAIRTAESDISEPIIIKSLIYHKRGWTTEIKKQMEARKLP